MRMDESDKRHVGEAIRQLAGVHRIKPTTDMQAGYWAGLKDMSREDFDRALAHIQRHSEWMPKPASFRAALKQGWL